MSAAAGGPVFCRTVEKSVLLCSSYQFIIIFKILYLKATSAFAFTILFIWLSYSLIAAVRFCTTEQKLPGLQYPVLLQHRALVYIQTFIFSFA